MYNNAVDRPHKELFRTAILSQVKGAKNFLCLPAAPCLDVEEGLELGAINLRTKIWAVESASELAPKIEEKLEHMGFLRFSVQNCFLDQAVIDGEIDFAYLDVCGQITGKFLWWLQNVQFTSTARVVFTFSYAPRSTEKTYYNQLLEGVYDRTNVENNLFFGEYIIDDENVKKVAGSIKAAQPAIKFNLAQTYSDTSKMMVLGGYFGVAPPIHFAMPTQVDIGKLEDKIIGYAKQGGVVCPQQLGGLRNSWNRLGVQDQRKLKNSRQKEMNKIGFYV